MTFFTLFYTRVTRKTLYGRFSKGETEALIEDMWQRYSELSPDLPDGISPTGKFLMKTGGASLALFHTLVNHRIEEGEARQIIADVIWSFIGGGSPLRKGVIRLQYKLSRTASRDPVQRLNWCLDPLWRFIFTTPPWEKRNLPSDDGVLALDVIRCPWADYFRSVGQPELGATAFCGADLKLAEIWGFDLKRNGLLVTGAPCCDFRFTPKNK
jgi:hypothetical protein